MRRIKIAILASGNGTNAQKIIEYFADHQTISVALICSNQPDAFVLERAKRSGIDHLHFTREQLQGGGLLEILKENKINYIVLAGFLLLIPAYILRCYEDKILNIHPSLLPAYGGKGMFGDHVHRKVLENNESRSGITIHLVNERYDEGRILFQKSCQITQGETTSGLAQKIHLLEHQYYPQVIENYILRREDAGGK